MNNKILKRHLQLISNMDNYNLTRFLKTIEDTTNYEYSPTASDPTNSQIIIRKSQLLEIIQIAMEAKDQFVGKSYTAELCRKLHNSVRQTIKPIIILDDK